MTQVSVIVTGHREGIVAGATAQSARRAIDYLTELRGAKCEVILVLDKADKITEGVLRAGFGKKARALSTEEGDPGQARNRGIEVAQGKYATFLDADDLWSFNWLVAAYDLAEKRPDAIIHSHCNVVFGRDRNVWWHIDSEGPLFDPQYLRWANYWDAMSFGRTDLYASFPFKKNDLPLGFGHEDWHWNCLTTAAGIPHKPAGGTVHFKRRRKGSQMSRVEMHDCTVWPLL